MTPFMAVFWKGFVIVLFTALNVTQVSQGRFLGAFVTGAAISWVWWGNAHSAAHVGFPRARLAYALGAACGTVSGMLISEGLKYAY